MPFLNPALFAGAVACVAIPILIHLLMRKRRKPIRWAAMRFLVEAYRRNRKRLLIERWLLLALRCLALLLLAVALGRPALLAGVLDAPGSRTLYILIDDSLSSTATNASGQAAVRRHAAQARELIESLDPMRGDRVGLISLSRPARGVVLAPSTDLRAVAGLIDAMSSTDARADLQGGVELVIEDLATASEGAELEQNTSGPVVVAVYSDWLEGTARGESTLPEWPEQAGVEFLISPPRLDEPSTVGVVEIRPTRGVTVGDDVGGDRVQIELVRSTGGGGGGGGGQAVSRVVLRGRTGGAGGLGWSPPIGQAVVRWSPGQTTASVMIAIDHSPRNALPSDESISLRGDDRAGGWSALRVELDADELPGDDVRYAAVQVRRTLRIGVVDSAGASSTGFDRPTNVRDYGPGQWARLALLPNEQATGIELRDLPTSSIERERLSDLAAIVLVEPAGVSQAGWVRLGEFVTRGGLLMIAPDADERGTPIWPDTLDEMLSLGWESGQAGLIEPAATIDAQRVGPLLALLAPELVEIASSVPVRRRLEMRAGQSDVVLTLSDGTPLVIAGRGEASRGLVVLLTTALDLEWTDLPARGLMVPLMQELIRQGIDAASPRSVSVAGAVPVAPPKSTEIRAAGRGRIRLGSGDAARFAGVWNAIDSQGASTGLAIVNPDADAGRARVRSLDDVVTWFESQTGQRPGVIGEEDGSSSKRSGAARSDAGWALPAIVLLLIVLVAEAILAKRFSHADVRTGLVPSTTGGGRR